MKKYLLFFALLLSMILMSGCVGSVPSTEPEAATSTTESQQPNTSVHEQFFDAYLQKDEARVRSLLGSSVPFQFTDMMKILADHMTVQIGEAAWIEERTVAKVTIQTIDLRQIIESVPDSISSVEEAKAWMWEQLQSDDVPIAEFQVSVSGSDYYIQLSPELSNALSGGFTELLSEVVAGTADGEESQ